MNASLQPPITTVNPQFVLEQLERILANPVFKASRRCTLLLRYLVDAALQNNTEHIKERTLGIEVFERRPDYDTSVDPIVRSTASDIRKRIAQYYHEAGHEMELRIDLPAGSYLPEFHPAENGLTETQASEVHAEQESAALAGAGRWIPLRSLLAVSVLLLAVAGTLAFYFHRKETALDQFWAPLLHSSKPVHIFLNSSRGDNKSEAGSRNVSSPVFTNPLGLPFLSQSDIRALVQITQLLSSNQTAFNVHYFSADNSQPGGPQAPSITELRNNSIIFIGEDEWVQKNLSALRFRISKNVAAQIKWIEDQQHPNTQQWGVPDGAKYSDYTVDYAIITRTCDPESKQTIVQLSSTGIHANAAAGEFITSPTYLSMVAPANSPEWKKHNLQIVISTKIAGDSWGPPQILTSYFW